MTTNCRIPELSCQTPGGLGQGRTETDFSATKQRRTFLQAVDTGMSARESDSEGRGFDAEPQPGADTRAEA